MKELDLLLERFLAVHGEALAAGCWPELETMLETEDDELWEWLQNPGTKRASPFHDLLERIRNVRQ